MRYITGFFRFWYDFIVGDDWRVAVALAVTALLAYALFAWVVLPLAVLGFLGLSLWAASNPK